MTSPVDHQEFDYGVESILGEMVCSVCGENHDRDESAACDGCEAIRFDEWVEATKKRLAALEEVVSAADEFVKFPQDENWMRLIEALAPKGVWR